ncbi:hypothetical protein [Nostoc sp. 2RC]|uniref:hypothetical protein n=1 Tax=Nostoc sp. 2RC TaxID=2485484 RepID=UPI001625B88D|nr:hypothetical protein [Nostoc sp. 2RC]MBC1237847.1 hypothetical protein [Nostoc sp. 2RC]
MRNVDAGGGFPQGNPTFPGFVGFHFVPLQYEQATTQPTIILKPSVLSYIWHFKIKAIALDFIGAIAFIFSWFFRKIVGRSLGI